MTAEQRAEVLAETDRRSEGLYGADAWRLRQRIRELLRMGPKPDDAGGYGR